VGGPHDLVRAARDEGVTNERVLEAFRRIRRERFVPGEWVGQADVDRPIPIAHGQVTTQPSLVARMVAALSLVGDERVLEVGTGLGFQTAILAHVAREVVSIERFADLAEAARENLAAAGVGNVAVIVGDGTLGAPARAPFDAIVVSAAAPEVPSPLVDQLREGGRLVFPVGTGGAEDVTAFRKLEGRLVAEQVVVPAHFVRLVGRFGLPDEERG
jgi:protein-L-isoaspartate(D-aspartate) O-methyltransferase